MKKQYKIVLLQVCYYINALLGKLIRPVLFSKLTLPLMVLTTDSGCSKISFCIKEL